MAPAIEVRPVRTAKERRAFVCFPWRIYQGDPCWVPPILRERAARLDPRRNPFFRHGEGDFFMAWRGPTPLGTVGVATDHDVNRALGQGVAVFGFFDCVQEWPAAQALLDRAATWARERGLPLLRGPQSFGPADEPGLLIHGRQTPPVLLMGWSPPYYVGYLERYGFAKHSDSLAYRAYTADYMGEDGQFGLPAKLQRAVELVRRRMGPPVRLRAGDLARWDEELGVALRVYNRALAGLPEFSPMDEGEWRRQGALLRPLLDPDLIVFVEVEGQPVGFGLAMPDLNGALRRCHGLRFPWHYGLLWWYSRRLSGVTFKIMAMLPEYWGHGLDALIYARIAETCVRKGYRWMDMSLTGEDNPTTNRLAQRMGARLDKRYRIYQLRLP
ncbi:MAG: hypothetical protein GX605_11505 [Chloroflexi bacterium]|nr:hypothetical protein [Chloroflexota bacterium]